MDVFLSPSSKNSDIAEIKISTHNGRSKLLKGACLDGKVDPNIQIAKIFIPWGDVSDKKWLKFILEVCKIVKDEKLGEEKHYAPDNTFSRRDWGQIPE